ncbi:hypothetical protein Ais01nite_23480 [Asanoa ishikariensis]|nr:hypothetical protein Ais01nite_23480 [Asanoa ishikariensis]
MDTEPAQHCLDVATGAAVDTGKELVVGQHDRAPQPFVAELGQQPVERRVDPLRFDRPHRTGGPTPPHHAKIVRPHRK